MDKYKESDLTLNKYIQSLPIPDSWLLDSTHVDIKCADDLHKIPKNIKGCYWIWTNEPIKHFMHRFMSTDDNVCDGRFIYNGIAQDIRARIQQHLLSPPNMKWGALAIDLNITGNKFATKHACDSADKGYLWDDKLRRGLPMIRIGKYSPFFLVIEDKFDLKERLPLSNEEVEFLNTTRQPVTFRNGINVEDDKHKNYRFKVCYISIENEAYRNYIEKEWRRLHGTPQLCTR